MHVSKIYKMSGEFEIFSVIPYVEIFSSNGTILFNTIFNRSDVILNRVLNIVTIFIKYFSYTITGIYKKKEYMCQSHDFR